MSDRIRILAALTAGATVEVLASTLVVTELLYGRHGDPVVVSTFSFDRSGALVDFATTVFE